MPQNRIFHFTTITFLCGSPLPENDQTVNLEKFLCGRNNTVIIGKSGRGVRVKAGAP